MYLLELGMSLDVFGETAKVFNRKLCQWLSGFEIMQIDFDMVEFGKIVDDLEILDVYLVNESFRFIPQVHQFVITLRVWWDSILP